MEFLGHMIKDKLIFAFVHLSGNLHKWIPVIKNIIYTYTWMSTRTQCSLSLTHIHTLPHTRSDKYTTPHPYSRHFLPRGIPENQVLSRSPVSPTFLPRAINDTVESETLAPKWLPIWDGGVTSLWQPGQALGVSSACANKARGQSSPHLVTSLWNRSVVVEIGFLVLHGSDSSQTVKTFSVLNDWLDDSRHQTQL